MRPPAVAGKFYPRSERLVKDEIERLFVSYLGPGEPSQLNPDGPRSIVGAVVPHAGYTYSGAVAAHVYGALAKDGFPETFVIIGPNHNAFGSPVATTIEEFSTPLGTVNIDEEIVHKLGKIVINDPLAHRFEHSIEVQLPFIQYFSNDVKFVPIAMAAQDYETSKEVADELKRACKGKDVVFIASSDFSHYVPAHVAQKQDMAVIEKILAMDSSGVYETVIRKNVSMCGYGPVMTMLEAAQGSKAELLKYANSGDVIAMTEVVGYAAITLTR
jgi:AmmeMemoRadiSam system protein B